MPMLQLLGWMHRKFRQNSNEPFKVFVIGQPSLDDQQCYPKPNCGTKPFKQTQRDQHLRKSFNGLEAARAEEEYYEDESSAAASELFHGFLAIGTLGSEQVITEPSTPTLAISVENITEKETEVTENELKLINDELEKVLAADSAKDEICNDSSGRNSHVSNGRSSHGSTITLSGKTLEGSESNGINGTTVCPLQGYLFGSAYELSETTTVAKKEHRTSLGELFQRTKLAEEISGPKSAKEEKRAEKEAEKSAMHLMKKKLKKKMLYASSRSSGGPADPSSAETKLNKILHMFHRKVHPETSSAEQKTGKYHKNENKKKTSNDGAYNSGDQVLPDEDIMLYPERGFSLKQSMRRYKSQSNPPQFALSSIDSNENREHWIKTDADYLVLEL
ncbi:hypothetical protein PRUPE_1G222800 [Prunus persica]|uniref:Protein LAZY 1 n=1 Tax=Prunus persica TaxID=3760 RepID=A0A251R1L1_PRUPE|nr:hypothetical protein PRUPE_1G222800 [Prunus persica]